MKDLRIVTVFGSSRPRAGDVHYAEAQALGTALAENGFTVCTGGYGGTMEAASLGAKEAGGRTLAVTSTFFKSRTNKWVDEEIQVDTWQDRLFELVRRGDGYVACPGGTGTLVELAVVWEMLNKGVMRDKPFVALGTFWEPIIERVREVELGHVSSWGEHDEALIGIASSSAEAATHLSAYFQKVASSSRPNQKAPE
jgi:uncharacterized protein (TIGR00730 family)